MTDQDIIERLSKQSPTGYKVNNIIPFSYPVRKIRIEVLVDKQPDASMVKIYNVILRAICDGLNTQELLFEFLGLGETDEFILRELFFLRKTGYVTLFSNSWMVTETGMLFIKNNALLRSEEIEKIEVLIDAISGEVLPTYENGPARHNLQFAMKDELNLDMKSSGLISGKFEPISELFKKEREGKEYLISYTTGEIERDQAEWLNFYLVEYVHESESNTDAKIEIREHAETIKINARLTAKFNSEYRNYYHLLSVQCLKNGQL